MDYPRFPISELHLGKFPVSLKFQSWKVNFKAEVCANSVLPQVTLQRIAREMGAPKAGPQQSVADLQQRSCATFLEESLSHFQISQISA